MAAIRLECGCAHTLRDETLQLGLNRMVLRSRNVPARLRSPGGTFHLLIEQICYRCALSGPDQVLLFLGEIACKGRDAVTLQPNAPVCNLDMRKNVGCRKLLLQALGCLVGIRGKRREVNKRRNSWVSARRRDDLASALTR